MAYVFKGISRKNKKQPYAKKHKVYELRRRPKKGAICKRFSANAPFGRRSFLAFLLGCFILWRALERAAQPRARLFKHPPQCQVKIKQYLLPDTALRFLVQVIVLIF